MTSNEQTTEAKHHYILGLGSNAAQRHSMVMNAIDMLRSLDPECLASSIYETDPLSGKGGRYANAVAVVAVSLPPEPFSAMLKSYELRCGRDDEARRAGVVPVDIDIVYVDGRCVRPKEVSRNYYLTGAFELGI